MTNECKARDIANLCERCMENGVPCIGCSECESRGEYYGALEMAEWKDSQISNIINYASEWLKVNFMDDTMSTSMLQDMINRFKRDVEKFAQQQN